MFMFFKTQTSGFGIFPNIELDQWEVELTHSVLRNQPKRWSSPLIVICPKGRQELCCDLKQGESEMHGAGMGGMKHTAFRKSMILSYVLYP